MKRFDYKKLIFWYKSDQLFSPSKYRLPINLHKNYHMKIGLN